MDRLFELLVVVRILVLEIGGTVKLGLLVGSSIVKAWKDFIGHPLPQKMASVDSSYLDFILV